MRSVTDRFTRVITHPAVDCGERVVRDELTPRRFVSPCGGVRQPGLDILPGWTSGIARRQQVEVDGSALTHWPAEKMPVPEVRERCEVFGVSHQPGNRTVVPGIS
jgi:hypothetical protein